MGGSGVPVGRMACCTYVPHLYCLCHPQQGHITLFEDVSARHAVSSQRLATSDGCIPYMIYATRIFGPTGLARCGNGMCAQLPSLLLPPWLAALAGASGSGADGAAGRDGTSLASGSGVSAEIDHFYIQVRGRGGGVAGRLAVLGSAGGRYMGPVCTECTALIPPPPPPLSVCIF